MLECACINLLAINKPALVCRCIKRGLQLSPVFFMAEAKIDTFHIYTRAHTQTYTRTDSPWCADASKEASKCEEWEVTMLLCVVWCLKLGEGAVEESLCVIIVYQC